MTTAHDLLEEPILSWRDAQGRRDCATLPRILAKLATGELVDFPRARAHQRQPWCMFLTQLATIALHRARKADPRLTEAKWRSLLLRLTDGAHEPWCLVVDDLKRPAFLQPPVPKGGTDHWSWREHPDDIDILVTAKGHDVKKSLIAPDDVEAWTFALVTLQTMQGYPGRGYGRIARMNGGYGNRPCIALATDLTLTARFTRDVQVLRDSWDDLVDKRGFNSDGLALVWMAPWSGKSSLSIAELAPHFIEICWRVRCRAAGVRGLTCAYTTTSTRRCLAGIDDGDAGDPWVPIERDKGALTVGRGGFRYELLVRLLFSGDFEPAAAQLPRPDDGDPMEFLASAMARGQGKTEGLHERVLPLTGAVRRLLGQPETRAALGRRASDNVQRSKDMGARVLFPAIKTLVSGQRSMPDEFDLRVDEIFFDHLFATLEQADAAARLAWDRRLHDIAWAQLQRGIGRCCITSARRYRAIADAEGVYRGCLNKHFPTLVASLKRRTQGVAS